MVDLERAWHPSTGQYRLAASLLVGMAELNALFPNRVQGAQEGTVGDLAHQAEGSGSDHNPNAAGVVRAWDIDCTGGDFDAQTLADYLAGLMRSGHPAFAGQGYVIFNHRITAWDPWGQWAPYSGADPHVEHIHVSVSATPANYDSPAPWGLAKAFGPRHSADAPKPTPTAGEEEDRMRFVRNTDNGHIYVVLPDGRRRAITDPDPVAAMQKIAQANGIPATATPTNTGTLQANDRILTAIGINPNS